MNVFRYKFILLYIVIVFIVRIVGGDIDSDALDRENEQFEDSERRVMEAYNDADWHVAHLKETDFQDEDNVITRRLNSACMPETFADKIRRYRRTLRNDAGFIEFVSAQAIPVDESELIQSQCIASGTNSQNTSSTIDTSIAIKSSTDKTEIKAIFPIMENTAGNVQLEDVENKAESVTPVSSKNVVDVAFRASLLKDESKTEIPNHTKVNTNKFTKGSVNQTPLNTTIVPPSMDINVSQAADEQIASISDVTASEKETPSASTTNKEDKKKLNTGPEVLHQATTPKVKQKKERSESRRGEYVFSSREYYDDVVDFDANACPDDVEVTILDLDIIRPYDIECELALEWSSLE